MGIFTSKPYKTNALTGAEIVAVTSSLEVAIEVGATAQQLADFKTALKEFRRGAISRESRIVIMACLAATLAAISDSDEENLRSTALKKKAVTQIALAMALKKIDEMG